MAGANSTGLGFGVDEKFGRDDAGTVFRSRTGTPSGDGLVSMDITDVTETNNSELYGAQVGLLADELAKAGIDRAVIANGDGSDPSVPDTRVSPYRRAAVGALMTSAGRVPGGQVDRALLQQDPGAPFGLRLDDAAVTDAFDTAWQSKSVVLVEGSDLVRADVSGRFASAPQAEKLRDQALRRTDALVGGLLDRVDLSRDLVIVVAPSTHADDDSLSVAAVAGPGFAPGLLRSTTTQTDGFVNITDVAPTVLREYGLDRPDEMEGRRMESAPNGDSVSTRSAQLANVNTDGLFRDSLIGASMGVVLGVACGLGLFVVLLVRFPRLRFLRGLLVFASVWELAFVSTVYLAGPLHFARHGGRPAYWAFVLGLASCSRPGPARGPSPTRRRDPRGAGRGGGPARRRPRDRRAPGVEHGVRLLADHRHPFRRRGQHDVRAARRGGHALRRAARVEGAHPARANRSRSACSR